MRMTERTPRILASESLGSDVILLGSPNREPEMIYVTVDETGDLGKAAKGNRHYVMVETKVDDWERFQDATRRIRAPYEIKYNTQHEYTERVIRHASPAVEEIYYVQYDKRNFPKDLEDDKERTAYQRRVHVDMADALSYRICRETDARKLIVEIDEKDRIVDPMVLAVFESNAELNEVDMKCHIAKSKDSYGLQTHDYFTGAIGVSVNKGEPGHVKLIREYGNDSKRVYTRSANVGESRGNRNSVYAEKRPHKRPLDPTRPRPATSDGARTCTDQSPNKATWDKRAAAGKERRVR